MAGRAARGRHLATRDPARWRWALAAAPVALALTATAVGFGLDRDRRFHPGLKLFYDNDVDFMTPREVLRLEPRPRVINYQ